MLRLHFRVLPWCDRQKVQLSEFDYLLRRRWSETLEKGVFLHGVESEPSRIPGHHSFVAVLCRNRAEQKRKPQSFINIKQELNPSSFNFTKVKGDEILLTIENDYHSDSVKQCDHGVKESSKKGIFKTDKCTDMPQSHSKSNRRNGDDPTKPSSLENTSVVINNSPYEFGHSLLIPELSKLHIQSITMSAIRMGIEVLLKSSHPGFRVMYNSLCAGASVNHLHLHCYYTEYWLNSEAFGMIPLSTDSTNSDISREESVSSMMEIPDCFELDYHDTCVRGFGFVITKQNYDFRLPNIVHKIVEYFNDKNIPHNIVIIRGLPMPSIEKYVGDKFINMKEGIVNTDHSQIENNISHNPNIPTIEGDLLPYAGFLNVDQILASSPLVGRLYIFPRAPLYGEKCYRKFLVNVTELFGHLYFGDVDVFNSMNEEDVVKALNAVSLSKEVFENIKTDIVRIISDL